MLYFVRVNGNSAHNDPSIPEWYVAGEPSHGKGGYINYCHWCLSNGLVRIGWPDTGDLRSGNRDGKRANCYTYESIAKHIQGYLNDFVAMPISSIVLMPDKDVPGVLYIGEVMGRYQYHADPPIAPYECAHRRDVQWDTDADGKPIVYLAKNLGITIRGGWWLRAFAKLDHHNELVERVRQARERRVKR